MLDILFGNHGEVGYLISIVVDKIIQRALVVLRNFIRRERSRHDEIELWSLRREDCKERESDWHNVRQSSEQRC